MNSLLPQTSLLVQSLGWALLQSLWQGLLIYACLRIVLAFAGKQDAKLRYRVSLLSLTAMFAWFVDTWAEQWFRLRNITVLITEAGVDATSVKTAPLITMPGAVADGSILSRSLMEVQPYLPVAVGFYLLGLCFMLARFGFSIYEVSKLRRTGIAIPLSDWTDWLQRKKEQLHISRPVQLFYSIYAKVPTTIGSLKPMILMPVAMAGSLSTEQLEAILLHELAHIKRNDYLLNIFQAVAETALFFNPFVWLASSIVRREREHCCDDLVLSCSAAPLPYAKALAALEAYRTQANTMTLAATGHKNKLFHRIKRIMEMKKQKSNYPTGIIATLVIAAMIISIACFSPSFAQSGKGKKKMTTSQRSTTKTYSSSKTSKTYTAEPPEAPEPPEAHEAPEAVEAPEPPEPGEAAEAPKAMSAADWEHVRKEMAGVDWDQINKEMEQAHEEMAAVDWDKVNADMKKAHKEMERAHKEMEQAHKKMDAVDWDNINDVMATAGNTIAYVDWNDINNAMASVNWDEVNKELANAQKEIAAVNWQEVQAEINKSLREANRSIKDPKVRKQVEKNLELARKQTEMAMKQANLSVAQAKLNAERQRKSNSSYNVAVASAGAGKGGVNVYSKGNGYGYSYGTGSSTKAHTGGTYEAMLSKMEREGLINRSKSYKVEKYSDRLYINGQLQPADVYNKYSKYLKNKDLTIKGDRDHIKINVKD